MRRGQFTVDGIMWVLMTILTLALLSPLFYTVISMLNGNATASGDNTTPAISSFFVPMMAIGVLISIYIYVSAGRNRQEG